MRKNPSIRETKNHARNQNQCRKTWLRLTLIRKKSTVSRRSDIAGRRKKYISSPTEFLRYLNRGKRRFPSTCRRQKSDCNKTRVSLATDPDSFASQSKLCSRFISAISVCFTSVTCESRRVYFVFRFCANFTKNWIFPVREMRAMWEKKES